MKCIGVIMIALLCSGATMDVTCEAQITHLASGAWQVECLGGNCGEEIDCLLTTLNASSGFSWTSCLCDGKWALQGCSAVLREGQGMAGEVYCLQRSCPTCTPMISGLPEGGTIINCNCFE